MQNPATAEFPAMPRAARQAADPDYALAVWEIAGLLVNLSQGGAGRPNALGAEAREGVS